MSNRSLEVWCNGREKDFVGGNKKGAFYNVTITDADTYDLYGYVEEKLED